MNKKLIQCWISTINDNRMKIYKNNVNTGSYTGTASETVFDSVLIPANTFQANDVVKISLRANKTGTVGTLTVRIRTNTTNNLTGSPVLVGTVAGSGATQIYLGKELNMFFKNSISSQQVIPNFSFADDFGQSTFNSTALTIDFSVDQYILITGQNTAVGDTQVLSSWFIEVFR